MTAEDESPVLKVIEQIKRGEAALITKQEEVRRRLEDRAREIVANHGVHLALIEPVALEKLEGIIIPWCSKLRSSGVYQAILNIVGGADRIPFSDPITYESPFNAIRELREREARAPFGHLAATVVTKLDQDYGEDQLSGWLKPEVWRTQFFVGYYSLNRRRRERDGFYVLHEGPRQPPFEAPLGGGGVDLETRGALATLGPYPILGLAAQIRSGRVDQVLEASLRRLR